MRKEQAETVCNKCTPPQITLVIYLQFSTFCGDFIIRYFLSSATGLVLYFCYGIHHSVESRRYAYQVPEEELVLLQPIPEQPMHEQLLNDQGHEERNIGYQRYHETKLQN